MAVDTLGDLLILILTPANEQDRDQVQYLTQQVQKVTGDTVEVSFVGEGYSVEKAARASGSEERLRVAAPPLGG